MAIESELLRNLAYIFVAASALLYVGKRLNQPTIPIYIVAGILLGQNFLGILGGSDAVLAMAQLGIIFLLFTAGLETELSEIRDLGTVIITAGVIHTVIAALLGFLLSSVMGFDPVSALYIGLFVAFSSTMEVLNILEKRFEITTLHGRIIMGILLIEDFIAIVAISGIGSFAAGINPLISTTISAVGVFAIALSVSRYVTPYVFSRLETTNESLLMAALSFCFLFMGISRFSGIPIAVGAFCGGLSLTKFPYGIEIRNNIKSLRDFFGTVFFVSLGALVSFSGITEMLLPLIVLSLLVIVIKPALTYMMMNSHGYGQRTSFLTGLGLGQVSEFSLFIVLEGLLTGVLPESVFILCLGVAIVTITISSYSYRHHGMLYDYFSDSLIDIKTFWSRQKIQEMKKVPDSLEDHVILVGCHVQGQEILQDLIDDGEEVLIVEYDPQIIDTYAKKSYETYYGDINHADFVADLNADEARMIISTVPKRRANQTCIRAAQELDLPVVARSNTIDDALAMYSEGADYVIFPELLSAEKASEIILDGLRSKDTLARTRNQDIQYLSQREENLVVAEYGPAYLQHMKDELKDS